VQVKELLQKASKADKPLHMSEVNYAETKYMILRKDGAGAWAGAAEVLAALPENVTQGARAYFPVQRNDGSVIFILGLLQIPLNERVCHCPKARLAQGKIQNWAVVAGYSAGNSIAFLADYPASLRDA